MKLLILKEKATNETRVAATPETVKEYVNLGIAVEVEKKTGEKSGFNDDDYKKAGAKISADIEKSIETADILLKLQPPTQVQISKMKDGAALIGLLASNLTPSQIKKYADAKVSTFAMEFIPRITRAQNMDVLSSQSNLAGYKAVIDAVSEFNRVIPMMVTAAGTIRPAKTLILGAGVAGLQAIATAKRLGAIVSAFDVRTAAKEQVESLGATFIQVEEDKSEDGETATGYAKEMSAEYKKKQSALIHETLKEQDIVICTALIPGKKAPVLIPEKFVKDMKQGSIIVDLAVASGGNCPLSEQDKVIERSGVKIVGYSNTAGRVANDASKLYAKNLFNFISLMIEKDAKKLKIDLEDEIIASCLLTHDGAVVHNSLKEEAKK